MMSDQSSTKEGKDETQSLTVTDDINSATLAAEGNSVQDVETATNANKLSPSPKSGTSLFKKDTPTDDNQNVSDSTASLSQATGNVNSVLQDEPGSKNTTSGIAPGLVDIKSSDSDDSKQLNVSFPLREVDQDAGIDTAMIETASPNELTEQETPKSSLEIVGKKASESENNTQSGEVEKVCLEDEINVDSETKLANSEEKSSESVDSSSSSANSESNKDLSSKLDQPLNSYNKNEEKSVEEEEFGTTNSIQKKVVEKHTDSVDSSVEELSSQKIKSSSNFEKSKKNDETVIPIPHEQLAKVACEQNVETVLDINQTETKLVCNILDSSSKPDAKQTISDLKQTSDAKQTARKAKQSTPEAKPTTFEAKHTTSEAKQTTPEAKQTTPEAKQTTPEAKPVTSEVKQTTLDAKQTKPGSKQTTSDAKQTTSEAKQTTSDAKEATSKAQQITLEAQQITSEAKQTTSKVKQTTPEVKRTLSDPKETASDAQQTTSEVKQTTSNAKEAMSEAQQITSEAKQIMSEAKQVTSEAKQITSETKQIMSEAKQTTSEAKQTTPEAKQTLSDPKETASDAQQTTSEGKQTTSDAKEATSKGQQITSETKQIMSEAKQTTSEAKQTTSEAKQTPPEAKQTLSDPKETTSDAQRTTSEGKQTTSDAKEATSKAQQITSEAKQIMSEAKQITSETKQIMSEAKQITSEAKQTTPEAKQTLSDSKETACDVKQTAPDSKQTTFDAKQTSSDAKQTVFEVKEKTPDAKQTVSEVKEKTPDAKQTSDPKQTMSEVKEKTPDAKQTSDPKQTMSEVKEKTSDVELSICERKETAPETERTISKAKDTTSEEKYTFDAKETKVAAGCKKLEDKEAKSNDNKSVSEVLKENAEISSSTQEVLESICVEKTGPGTVKLTDSSPEKVTDVADQSTVAESSKDFVNLQVSGSSNQEAESENSLVNKVDIVNSASDDSKTVNDKSIKNSVDSTLKASKSNSPFAEEPLIGETVPSSEKISVNEGNNFPKDEKSGLVAAECNIEHSVSVHSSSDVVIPPVKENGEPSNSVDESVHDLPSNTKDSSDMQPKKQTINQNKIDQAVVEPKLAEKKLKSAPEVVKSDERSEISPSNTESSVTTVEVKLVKKEAENALADVKLVEKKSSGITECPVSPLVTSKLKSQEHSGEANSLSKVESKKTDLESAIEAVKEEAENIKSMKESTSKSSDTEKLKHPNKTVEPRPNTEKDMPSVKTDGALSQTEKPESITVAPNVAVVDKINGTAVSAVENKQDVSDKSSEISSKALPAADTSCNVKISLAESEQKQQKEPSQPGNKVPPAPKKPKTTKVMPSLREIRKVPLKSVSKEVKSVSVAAAVGGKSTPAKGTMSVSIVTKPKLSETDSDSVETAEKQVGETKFGEVSEGSNEKMKAQEDPGKSISEVASDQKAGKTQSTLNDSKQMTIKKVENVKPGVVATSNGSKSIVKPRSSIENDPLLNITSECRVELEITKIPANCQLKTEPGGKPVFVLKKDSTNFSTQENADKKQKSLLKNFASNSGQTSKMMTSARPLNKVSGMTKVSSDDSVVVNRPVGAKRPGRKRAITIDMTRPSGLQPPAVKVVKMDPSLKSRNNLAQMPRTFPKAGPSPKTTSALEMLLMNRGVTHNIPISDASVANFCQVEQLVTEPDMYSTPINQLKKLSKGPADSILKQIAFGSQQFGAITISPVKPTPSPQVVRPVPSGVPLKAGPRPAPVVRSSSVDNVIEGVVAGQGVISDKCLLELNSAGEPKKKRGRPRKIIPGASPQVHQGENLQCAPDLFFLPDEKQPVMKTLAPKPASVPVSTPVAAQVSSPVSETPVLTPTESEVETPEVEEEKESEEPKKSASGRVVRSCALKESKKKASATPNSGNKSPRSGKKKKDDEPAEPDPEEEARKQKALEEEVRRKAELKEKRQQERREKMELRTKALAEKKAKLKRRAEERKRQYYEKKQRLQEEKAEMERQRALAPPENFSEETQMGDENESAGELIRNKKGRMEVIDPESSKEFKVHQVAEYQWPLQGGEFFMLQEQISQYLGVKSFKRKYPDIKRRTIEAEERTFLCDSGLVSETMCDLGLTALRSADVLDIMFADFHDKYEEFRQHLRDMQAKEFSLKQLALAGKPTGDQLDSIERAVQSAARWNSALNKSRQESRRCCLDLQTFVIQYPRSRLPKVTQDLPKIGHYPISLIPGQFTDYYKPYSAADLRYLPINTVLYGPIKPYNVIVRESQNDFLSESEDSSSSDGSSSSSSDSSDSEDSGGEVAMDVDVPGQEGAICKICNGNKNKNKRNKPEVLIHCAQCTGSCHPSCLDLSLEMVPHIQRYEWQCTDCKKCLKCKEVSDEDKMLFCDLCDRGYHFYCVGLKKVPVGRWHCQECAVCASCSCHEPGPDETSLWHHEFKRGGKGGKNTYLRSFCENCAKDQTPVEGNILKRES